MTRGLRRRHLFLFVVLALLIPIGYLLGLAGRREVPAEKALPAPLSGGTSVR